MFHAELHVVWIVLAICSVTSLRLLQRSAYSSSPTDPKMEAAINKLPQVEAATVSFFTQKMTVTYAEGVDEAEALAQIKKCIRRVEPDCEVVG